MDAQRRTLLRTAPLAGLAAVIASCTSAGADPAPQQTASARGTGKPGEFDFLQGDWRIANRRLKAPGEWDEFPGEATCWTILKGVGSVEELRIPARDFSGMGLRLLDMERRIWSDFWVNAKSGALASPGQEGAFIDGAGVFISEDVENGEPVLYRGVWDEITPRSCRWRQGASRDGGKTWDDNWIMNWTRA